MRTLIADAPPQLSEIRLVRSRYVSVLFGMTCNWFVRGFVMQQPMSFDDVQSRGLRRAEPVDHGKGPDFDPHRVYDQRVAFVMADGIPIPRRGYLRRMLRIHAHVADL